jgi:hypothetical protein
MKRRFQTALASIGLALASPTLANQPDVSITDEGQVIYYSGEGRPTRLSTPGKFKQATLAPDDRTVAFIEILFEGTPAYDDTRTQLWIADGPTGQARILFKPRPADDRKANMAALWNPVFSLNGGFVYVESEAWVTSAAIHQINVKTGAEKYVVDGSIHALVRTGPYRGYLLVQRHLYPKNAEDGAYDEVHLIRPDGKFILAVPGSKDGDPVEAVDAWVKAKGWSAW